jgi:GT2 family glycosyltransferase
MNNLSELKTPNIGVVVIGRNEGERLVNCLNSLREYMSQVVYVDSASTDYSKASAAELGAHVIALDMDKPFTAARARNVGFASLVELCPSIEWVQFVDGDCMVAPEWMNTAANYLQSHSEVAVVCGRRKELFPHKSIYNQLCDLEWNTPIGQAKACGGDAMMRVDTFKLVGGFRDSLIAGEEPELCIRIRQAGYKIWRLDTDMTYHDAAILLFSQWWKRTMRGGYAFAEGASLHGAAPEFHWVTESRRAWLWGFIIPIIIIIFSIKSVWGLLLLFVYPLQLLKLMFKSQLPLKMAFLEAFYLNIAKFAELLGQLKFLLHRYRNKQGNLIEYK